MFEKKTSSFNRENGEVSTGVVNLPRLCISCKKNDDPSEEVFCILNRAGQQDSDAFHCNAYQAIAF